MASRMTVQYILSVIESAITSTDNVKNKDDISSLVLRLDYLNRVIVGEGLPDPIVSSLGEVLFILREKEMEPDWEINSTDVDMESRRRRGRPSFDVKEEQLSFLVENDFKVPEISLMLGVSTRTVERRLSSFGISISGKLEDLVLRLYWCTDKRIVKPPPTEGFTLIYVSKRDALINLNWYVYTYISFTFVTPTD